MRQFDLYEVYKDMGEDKFFELFPRKADDAHKGSFGKLLLISGSLGMAGAACLNITGAKALGFPYIHVALPEEIYPVCASRHITPVYHPFVESAAETVEACIPQMRAVCFGSGADKNDAKMQIFNTLMNKCRVPLVLDAEALKIIKRFQVDLREFKCPLIFTPHHAEFSVLSEVPLAVVAEDPVSAAAEYAAENDVIMVLKSHRTVVAAPDGRYYINNSGSNALAQAGSGDVLAGMITAMLCYAEDPFEAACMAVFMHGYIADMGLKEHSRQCFPLEKYPAIADKLFFAHGL